MIAANMRFYVLIGRHAGLRLAGVPLCLPHHITAALAVSPRAAVSARRGPR
jgi:hypothetical protein